MNKSSSGWLALLFVSVIAIMYQSADRSTDLLAEKNDQKSIAHAENLFSWTADQVTLIHVSLAGSKSLVLNRTEKQEWSASKKLDAALWKNFDVNVFLGTLSRAKEERQYGKEADGAKYGFAQPVVLRLEGMDAAHAIAEIKIGDLAPDGLSRYVLISGKDTIISIPNYHVKDLLRLYSSLGA